MPLGGEKAFQISARPDNQKNGMERTFNRKEDATKRGIPRKPAVWCETGVRKTGTEQKIARSKRGFAHWRLGSRVNKLARCNGDFGKGKKHHGYPQEREVSSLASEQREVTRGEQTRPEGNTLLLHRAERIQSKGIGGRS